MAAGGVWLSPIDVACFIHAFEPGNPLFLIELGTLCEISHAIEILDLEEIAAALRPASDDLRRHDFRKSPTVQRLAKGSEDFGLDAEDVGNGFGAKRQRTILQEGIQPNGFHIRCRLERESLPRPVQNADLGDVHFAAGLCSWLIANCAQKLYDVLSLNVIFLQRL